MAVRHLETSDGFDPQSLLIKAGINFFIVPEKLDGSICEVPTKDNEPRIVAAERVSFGFPVNGFYANFYCYTFIFPFQIQELFYTRTELISRALSGSHVISKEEALEDLRQKYEATQDSKLEQLLHFPWDALPVRFRRIVNRSRARIPTVTQAEIRLETQTGVYLYYFNFIPCDICYTSLIRYSYVIALEEAPL